MANRKKPLGERPRASMQFPLNESEVVLVDNLVAENRYESRARFGYDMFFRGLHAPRVEAIIHRNVPCGPWQELKSSQRISLSDDVALALGYKRGDFLAVTDGTSMEELGIPDCSLVLLRPGVIADVGDIVLWEAELPDGRRVGTLKKYKLKDDGRNGTALSIRDGQGNEVEMPADAVELRMAGVKRGIVRRD